jgi:hypothetical protein
MVVVPAAAWPRCYQKQGQHLGNSVPPASASLPLETWTPRSESAAVLDDREARSAFGDSCFKPDGGRRAEEDAECGRPAAVRRIGDAEARCQRGDRAQLRRTAGAAKVGLNDPATAT